MVAVLKRGLRTGTDGRGDVAVVDATGSIVACDGDAGARQPSRVVLAPFAAVPLVASGAASAFGLTSAEIAVACATATPTTIQRAVVASMLGKVRSGMEARCPESVPAFDAMLEALDPCPGDRAARIAMSCHLGDPIEDPVTPTHPISRRIRAVVSAGCGLPLNGVDGRIAVDFPAIPMRALAAAAGVLADPEGSRWTGEPSWRAALCVIREAILRHPELVSGEEAIDTTIVCATDGRVLARLDPAGVLCLAVPERRVGIAMGNQRGGEAELAATAADALASLDLLDPVTLDRLRRWLSLPASSDASHLAMLASSGQIAPHP